MAKKKTAGVEDNRDELLSSLKESLVEAGVPATFLADEETPVHLMNFVHTGASLLDLAIANRPNAGIPIGRITELAGLEGTGKSLICAHLVANIQKSGGIAILFDTESAFSPEFFAAVGVDLKRLIHVHENRLEVIFDQIEKIINNIRQKGENDKEVLFVVDSIAAAVSVKDIEQGYEQKGYGTEKSKFLSRALPLLTDQISKQKIALVITNQLRQKLDAMPFQDKYKTTGGMTMPYYFSVRVRLSKVQTIKNKDKEEVGVTVEAKVIKNRLGPPGKKARFDIYYDRGIDDTASWIQFMKDHDIITGTNGNFTYEDRKGEEHRFKLATWNEFKASNPAIEQEMYARVAETMVVKYQSTGVSTADGSAVLESAKDDANDNADIED
jgi:recombination protein RecA